MKSNKQKRAEIDAHRARARDAKEERRSKPKAGSAEKIVGDYASVNCNALAPHNSYGEPDYVRRGHYVPVPFLCKDCGKDEVWTPRQQKWWYEIAKGGAFTTAIRCRACRRRERDRRAAARKTHLDGLAKKAADSVGYVADSPSALSRAILIGPSMELVMRAPEISPRDIARRVAERRQAMSARRDVFKRATFTLDRVEARAKAREWFDRYPKAAYMTEIEFWRELEDGRIEFTIRRLPSAD